MALAAVLAIRAPQPEVLVASDGQALAVRGADGRLAILRQGGDAFTVREWLAADGDARLPADPALRESFVCDAVRLHRQARRRPDRVLRAGARRLRGGLRPRRAGRHRARGAAALRGHHRRPQAVAQPRRAFADARWRPMGDDGGPPSRPGPALGARSRHASRNGTASVASRGRSRAMRRLGWRIWSREISTAGTARPSCPGCAPASAAGCGPHRRCWRAPARSRRRGGGSA